MSKSNWTGQEKFSDLSAAKARAKELVEAPAGTLDGETLYIIHDLRNGMYYVEDGTPMIRPFEKVVWEL